MNALFFCLTIAVVVLQTTAQTNAATVEGIVIRRGTSEPISGARVVLMAGDTTRFTRLLANRSANDPLGMALILSLNSRIGSSTTPVSTVTDVSGHFSFKDVAPGEYLIGAELDGYWAPDSLGGGATTVSTQQITVMDRQPTAKVSLPLIPAAIISGRVFDSNDQPIPNIAVGAYRVVYQFDGRAGLTLAAVNPAFTNARTTNDRGEYRLFGLAPGEYYIGTTIQRGIEISDPQKRYAFTFYPNAVDTRKARRLSVREEESITGIDIQIQTMTTMTISGQIIDEIPAASNNRPTRAPSFHLVPLDPNSLSDIAGTTFSVTNSVTRPEDRSAGKFEIHGVFPGDYDLIAEVGLDIRGFPFPARTHVEVLDRDVQDVKITARPGVDLKVRVTLNGNASVFQLDKVRVYMYPLERLSIPFYSMVHPGEALAPRRVAGSPEPAAIPLLDSTGAFPFSSVAEARYQIDVAGLPEDAYIADMRQASGSIYDDGLIVGDSSPGEIQVLVNGDGGIVEGQVQDEKQKAFPNANVVLVPLMSRRNNLALYKRVTTDKDGHFLLRGIAPGEYKLFAWENLLTYAHLNADFLAKYESRGLVIRIAPGIRIASQPLNVIPVD